jgi:hypothetical protein
MNLRNMALGAVILMCTGVAGAAWKQSPQLSQDENARIPAGARVFIGPIEGGYDIYLAAAIHKKAVPVVITTDRTKADFELSGVTESEKAGWAKIVFWGNTSSSEQASVKMVNIKTGTVVWGYNVNKSSSARGKQSSAESCAKHLKEKIEKGSL